MSTCKPRRTESDVVVCSTLQGQLTEGPYLQDHMYSKQQSVIIFVSISLPSDASAMSLLLLLLLVVVVSSMMMMMMVMSLLLLLLFLLPDVSIKSVRLCDWRSHRRQVRSAPNTRWPRLRQTDKQTDLFVERVGQYYFLTMCFIRATVSNPADICTMVIIYWLPATWTNRETKHVSSHRYS